MSSQAFFYAYAGESEVGAISTSSSVSFEVLRLLESDMTFGPFF